MAVSVDALAERVRRRFPIFERLAYINSCSQGALSDAVRDAYARYLSDWDQHGAPWEYWVAQLDAARTSVAGLLNANPDEIDHDLGLGGRRRTVPRRSRSRDACALPACCRRPAPPPCSACGSPAG